MATKAAASKNVGRRRTTNEERKLCFPRVSSIQLESFSLYRRQPDIELAVPPGVFCLAGANGIGKSTFLATINYAITGVVPVPDRPFKSYEEYYQEALRFTDHYFDGRIDEEDRPAASVSVELLVNEISFRLTRGLFDREALRELRIVNRKGNDEAVEFEDPDRSDAEKNAEYRQRLATAVGVSSFEQFVFLQHFVLTFDEGRSLLFWNPIALQSAMFLAFGGDPESATKADKLRRQMERAESKGRNLKYQSLNVVTRLNTLRGALGEPGKEENYEELRATYDALYKRKDEALQEVEAVDALRADADIDLADSTSKMVSLRGAYTAEFGRHIGDHSYVDAHPLIAAAISEAKCEICGTRAPGVSTTVQKALKNRTCPLCGTQLERISGGTGLEVLKDLDEQIKIARQKVDLSVAARARILISLDSAKARLTAAEGAIQQFESQHSAMAGRLKGNREAGASNLQKEIERLQQESAALLRQSRDAYKLSAGFKKQLQTLQQKLQKQYSSAEAAFVPEFKKLAELFLGIELDILVESRTAIGFTLVPELRRSRRRNFHQLSESQRFFLDIALRMALAIYAAAPNSAASLFIDTPEGALDIAYEARAGKMFASFATTHDIIMTANINTSKLLQELAAQCGPAKMTLVRMTAWTDLSEIQLEEEELFHMAFAQIEEQLAHGHANP